jgi:hypothetical protein
LKLATVAAVQSVQAASRLKPTISPLATKSPNLIVLIRVSISPSGDVRHGWARAERDFIEVIDGSQSAWVKLAEDHSLG